MHFFQRSYCLRTHKALLSWWVADCFCTTWSLHILCLNSPHLDPQVFSHPAAGSAHCSASVSSVLSSAATRWQLDTAQKCTEPYTAHSPLQACPRPAEAVHLLLTPTHSSDFSWAYLSNFWSTMHFLSRTTTKKIHRNIFELFRLWHKTTFLNGCSDEDILDINMVIPGHKVKSPENKGNVFPHF